MEQRSPLTDYLKTLTEASNTVWKVFRTAYTTGQKPTKAFSQICDKYSHTEAARYVNAYTRLCEHELANKERSDDYIKSALKITGEMWTVFKFYFEKVKAETMSESDWSGLAHGASLIGQKRCDTKLWGYAYCYTLICVYELDRLARRLNGITDDMTLTQYMARGE